MPSSGTKLAYSVSQVVHDTGQLDYRKPIFKNDQEPAILGLQKQVVVNLGENATERIPENSPASEPQSNGFI